MGENMQLAKAFFDPLIFMREMQSPRASGFITEDGDGGSLGRG